MEEESINYATVQFRKRDAAPREVKKEEDVVYDEVMGQRKAEEPNGLSADKSKTHHQQLSCCLGTVCVILLSVVAVCVYFVLRLTAQKDDIHDQANVTNHLLLKNENLRRDVSDLTAQLANLTQNYSDVLSSITDLRVQNQQLKAQHLNLTTEKQHLETERNELREQLVSEHNEFNVSRAQWAIDNYCPKGPQGRVCTACQSGWLAFQSSCYAVNNPARNSQKNWREAREDCRSKNSHLVVVVDENEKDFVSKSSWPASGIKGYWIGLSAENGRWKWINGSFLTNRSWMNSPPTYMSCVTSLQNQVWKSVRCDERNAWICKKQGLSV